jgi:hypothetical protein
MACASGVVRASLQPAFLGVWMDRGATRQRTAFYVAALHGLAVGEEREKVVFFDCFSDFSACKLCTF